jgi:hypothetical protein
VTILMSERGLPRSYRHMNGCGSHQPDQRPGRPVLGQVPLQDNAGRPREPSVRPLWIDRAGRLSEVALLRAGDAGGGCRENAV